MWLENLKELRKEKGNPSCKWISEKSGLTERSINRIFAGETDCPKADNLYKIINALGGSLDDILADTKAIVGDESLVILQENLNAVITENNALKDEVAALTAEIDKLKLILAHKEEIIEIHTYYKKLLSEKG